MEGTFQDVRATALGHESVRLGVHVANSRVSISQLRICGHPDRFSAQKLVKKCITVRTGTRSSLQDHYAIQANSVGAGHALYCVVGLLASAPGDEHIASLSYGLANHKF